MTIFIALLLEVGSGMGMYIAFSQWRLYDREAPAAPMMASVATSTAAAAVAAPVAVQVKKPRIGANDNRTLPPQKLLVPETDVQRFYKENVDSQDGHTVSATALYESYCVWCEERQKELSCPADIRPGDCRVRYSEGQEEGWCQVRRHRTQI